MVYKTMYPPKANSPETTLEMGISEIETTLYLADISVLPDAPNLAVLGTGGDAETVLYTGKGVDSLTGCTRGFEGAAAVWPAGTPVARRFCAYDLEAVQSNALPAGTFGDTLFHDGTEWGVENTGPLTTPKRTLVVLGSSLMLPETNGATIYEEVLAGGRIVRGASFEASASAITAQIGLPMPANWDGGTVTAQFLFATAAVTGTVILGIAGRASVNSGSLDQAFGTPQTVTLDIGAQTNPAAWDLWTTAPTPAVTVASVGEGRNWVQFEITRDPGDTCADAIVLLAAVVEYGTSGFSDA